MTTITILAMSGATFVLRPFPMNSTPSANSAHWRRFKGATIPGSTLSDVQIQCIQTFIARYKTEALTDGTNIYTLADRMLAHCNPFAASDGEMAEYIFSL